jgi:hypothetical protein
MTFAQRFVLCFARYFFLAAGFAGMAGLMFGFAGPTLGDLCGILCCFAAAAMINAREREL